MTVIVLNILKPEQLKILRAIIEEKLFSQFNFVSVKKKTKKFCTEERINKVANLVPGSVWNNYLVESAQFMTTTTYNYELAQRRQRVFSLLVRISLNSPLLGLKQVLHP